MAIIDSVQHVQTLIYPDIEKDEKRIAKKVAFVQEALPELTELQKKAYLDRINKRDQNGKLPLEKAIIAHDFNGFLTLLLVGADCKESGESLLHLALKEEQMDVFQKLLMEGVAPKEKTLLSLAISQKNHRAFALLETYGLKADDSEKAHLLKAGEISLSTGELILFGSACAYWGVRAFTHSEYAANMIHILGGTYALYTQLSHEKSLKDKVITALGLAGLEMMPVTNICMRLFRASTAILSAYRSLKQAAPLQNVVRIVNAAQALYMLKQTSTAEFQENEKLKNVVNCRGVTVEDVEYLDTLPDISRMEWVLAHPEALDCPPVLERTFPGWSCENFAAQFRKASLAHHPDHNKKSDSSAIQTVLNAVRSFWRSHCR